MNILCKIVGHKPPVYAKPGWYSPGEQYGRLVVGVTDGIGRTHAKVECECARCGVDFTAARVHLPPNARVEPGRRRRPE